MATRSVKFTFSFPHNPSSHDLHFYHVVPAAIVSEPPPEPEQIMRVGQLFASTVDSIANMHQIHCMMRCGSKCVSCGKRCRKIAPIPVETCYDPENSSIRLAVHPLCEAWECLYQSQRDLINQFGNIMFEPGNPTQPQPQPQPQPQTQSQSQPQPQPQPQSQSQPQPLVCKVCGAADAKRCTICKDVAYCGREHQRQDWKSHKKACVKKTDHDGSHVGASNGSSEVMRRGEDSKEEEDDDDWVSTDDESHEDDYVISDDEMHFTYSGVFNLGGPVQLPTHVELTREQVVTLIRGGRF